MASSLNVVIVGNGVAGVTAARLIKEKSPKTQVSIYTADSYHYYPRPKLYNVLSGASKPQDILTFSEHWYQKKGIKVHLNTKVLGIDTKQKEIILDEQKRVTYDKLLLATGSNCLTPSIPGIKKTGTFTLRTINDALTIKKFTTKTKTAIVIGGGLLGLEFAASLNKLGQHVTVVELSPRLLPNQLDPDGAQILKQQIESLGINVVLDTKVNKIVGTNSVSGIFLATGKIISGNLILFSTGVRSNTKLALDAGINVNRGIIVDPHLKTSANDVYAAGDVAEFNGKIHGLISTAMEQAKIAAMNMIKEQHSTYVGTFPVTTLDVVGIDLTSMGIVNSTNPKYEEIKKIDTTNGVYKKIVLEHGKIVGAILLGTKKGVTKIKQLMAQQTCIAKHKNTILR